MSKRMTTDQAADALATAVRRADAAVYSVRQREHAMLPRQYDRELNQAKQEGLASINAARADLDRAVARDRQEHLRDNAGNLTGEWAARRTLYATQAMAMAQSGMADLERGIRDQLTAGNQVAAREYLAAGGSRLRAHMSQQNKLGDYDQLRRAAASERDAKRAGHVKSLDVYAEQTARLDTHLRGIGDRLGQGNPDADPDTPRHDLGRVVELWHDTAVGTSSEAAMAEAQAYAHAAAELGTADL